MRARSIILVVTLLGVLAGALVVLPSPRRAIREAVEYQWLVLTGGLVDVGGYRLRIECAGAGSPTVVMDAGLNQTRSTWDKLKPELTNIARVCTYDRAGLGRSEPAPKPRTSEQIVKELDTLLRHARVPAPFILVGHSFGGLNVRLYASRHPDQVAGLVLVDASHEDEYARFAALMPRAASEEYLRHEGGGNYEGIDLLRSAEQVRAALPLPAVPGAVISADPRRRMNGDPAYEPRVRTAQELQTDLARLLPNARYVVAEGSGHFVQEERPDVVVDAIRMVIAASIGQRVAQGTR